MDEVLEYLKKAEVFFLATVEDGKPRVRPFSAVTGYNGKIYMITGNDKPVFRQIMENNNIEISAYHDHSWLKITAEAVRDGSREAKTAMLEDNPDMKER